MARLTVDIDDQLMNGMLLLASAQRRDAVEIVEEAIARYILEHPPARPARSVKVSAAGVSVSVTARPATPDSSSERERLSELTFGIWKGRGIDGLQYQLAQRRE